MAKYNGTENAFSFEVIGEVSYRVKGNRMMISVPLELLGVEHCDYMNFNFKWVDSDSKITTMEQFYTEGDVAPLGRMNYVFNTVMPGSTPPSEEETEAPTETAGDVTEGTVPEDTTAPAVEDTTAEKSGGCKSVLPSLILPAAVLSGAALTAKRKRDEE